MGNVRLANFLNIYEGELCDEVVDVHFIRDTVVSVMPRDAGNVYAKPSIVIHGGELVDEVFDSKSVALGKLPIGLLRRG